MLSLRVVVAFVLAALLVTWANGRMLLRHLAVQNPPAVLDQWLLAILPVWGWVWIASRNRWLLVPGLLALLPVFIVPGFIAWNYHATPDLMVLALVGTHAGEASRFVSSSLLLTLSLALLVAALTIKTYPRWIRETLLLPRRTRAVSATLLGLVVLVGLPGLHLHSVTMDLLPYAYATQFAVARRHSRVLQPSALGKVDLGERYPAQGPQGDLAVVLVIGETARAASFALNGYPRPTNPRLARVKGLVSFDNAWACRTLTHLAFPCLVTRSTAGDLEQTLGRESTFIPLFNSAGFHSVFLSTEPNWAFLDPGYDHLTKVAQEAKEQSFGALLGEENKHHVRRLRVFSDEVLLPQVDQALAHHPRLLLVISTLGSHYPYVREYIQGELAPFQPSCDTLATCTSRQGFVNAYDNTIVYTDYFLSEILARLENRKALFFYVSDHGESLGEDRFGKTDESAGEAVYFHGQEQDSYASSIATGAFELQRRVPLLAWASPELQKDPDFPRRWANLVKKRRDKVSHDNVFHSLVDCAGLKTRALNPRLSLCGDKPVPAYDAFAKALK